MLVSPLLPKGLSCPQDIPTPTNCTQPATSPPPPPLFPLLSLQSQYPLKTSLYMHQQQQPAKHPPPPPPQLLPNHQSQIFSWLASLPPPSLQCTLTITNPSHLTIINSFLSKADFRSRGFSRVKNKEEFYARATFRYKKDAERKREAEGVLLSSLCFVGWAKAVCWRVNEIEVEEGLERLLGVMNVFSDELVFRYERTCRNMVEASQWLRVTSCHSACEWIVHMLEAEILERWEKRDQPSLALHNQMHLFQQYSLTQLPSLLKQPLPQSQSQPPQQLTLQSTQSSFKASKLSKALSSKSLPELCELIAYPRLLSDEDPLLLDYCKGLLEQMYAAWLLQQVDDRKKRIRKRRKKKGGRAKRGKGEEEEEEGEEQQEDASLSKEEEEEKREMEKQEVEGNIGQEEKQEKIGHQNNEKIENIQGNGTHHRQQQPQPTNKLEQHKEPKPSSFQQHQPPQPSSPSPNHPHHHHPQKLTRRRKRACNLTTSTHLQSFLDQLSSHSNKYIPHRKLIHHLLKQTLEQTLETPHTLILFGSCSLGLATADSDIDLVVSGEFEGSEEGVLRGIEEVVAGLPWVKETRVITAVVPVLKMRVQVAVVGKGKEGKGVEVAPMFCVDLSVQTNHHHSHHLGLQSTQLVRSILSTSPPTLLPLTFLLKLFLRARGLHLTYLGGLNSYTLFLLVTAIYKHKHLHQTNLFLVVTETLGYLAREFDHRRVIVDVFAERYRGFVSFRTIKEIGEKEEKEAPFQGLMIVSPFGDKWVKTNCYLMGEIQEAVQQLEGFLVGWRDYLMGLEPEKAKDKKEMMRFKEGMRKVFDGG